MASIRALSSFDRLLPRYSDQYEGKKRRCEVEPSCSDEPSKAKKANNSYTANAKKEYSKLRTLVPALSERQDLSKVEIIEETIRYIDALHHQLAARSTSNNNQDDSHIDPIPETNPESEFIRRDTPSVYMHMIRAVINSQLSSTFFCLGTSMFTATSQMVQYNNDGDSNLEYPPCGAILLEIRDKKLVSRVR